MRLNDSQQQEYFELIYTKYISYKQLLEDICTGVPIITGMASDYRRLTLKEIEKAAKEVLK